MLRNLRCFRTHGGVDGHDFTPDGEVRKRERENETLRTMFMKLRIIDDYSNDDNIQRSIEYNHYTDDQTLDIVEIDSIHFDMSNKARSQ